MEIILASGSPRRKELLTLAGVNFRVIPSGADENIDKDLSPAQTVEKLAALKASDVFSHYPNCAIIGSDTIVAADGGILGKPADENDAFNMLSSLSGKTHSVFTGVCIKTPEKTVIFSEETRVTFYPLTPDEIREYIATGEPMDKAGAYGIQGRGCTLVEKIDGDYFNVVGLPIAKTVRKLKELNII